MRTAKSTAPEGAIVNAWRGLTRYQCSRCGYDTLERQKFDDHWQQAHGTLETHSDEQPAAIETEREPLEVPVEA